MTKTYSWIFTVFTPTYNRSHTLARVYCSLRRQTFKNFEWLIIDDGSSDNTRELVAQWIRVAPFRIRYYYQNNSGKHIAINRAVQLAEGELFLIADSDDSFLSISLERFYYYWKSIPQEKRRQFSAVACHSVDIEGKLIGKRFPFNPTDSDSEEILFRYKVTGEKWGFQRTEVLKEYPFPEMKIKCFPESYIWNRIAKKYKVRFVNEQLRIYHHDAGERLMEKTIDEAATKRFYYADSLDLSAEWIKYAPLTFFKNGLQYTRFCFWKRDRILIQWKRLKSMTGKYVWLISILPGFLLCLVDRIRYRILGSRGFLS